MGSTGTLNNKRTWNYSTLHELHVVANSLLRQAMLNERYKRWKKVVDLYQELLWIIDIERFPSDYEPPSVYSMLLYELHFHLGVAYQHLGNHAEAVTQFSKAIEDVSVAKNGCLAGCLTNSCLMTPIYARRAFANAKRGSYKLSLKDAEKAVVLDSGSPDVYCVRALVRSSFDDEVMEHKAEKCVYDTSIGGRSQDRRGLRDLETAMQINPNHVCSTMLKASFTKPLVTDENEQYGFYGKFPGNTKQHAAYEKLREKAVRLCQDAETYLTCNSFLHPCVLEFYDKFLFPLSVPHTITRIDLTPEKPTKKQLESSGTDSTKAESRPSSSGSADSVQSSASSEIFRCGTTSVTSNNRISLKRRIDYGNAIRKFVSRPKSAKEFFAQLEKQNRYEKIRMRAQSALIRPGEKFARLQSTPFGEAQLMGGKQSEEKQVRRPMTAPVGGRVSALSTIRSLSPEKLRSTPVTFSPTNQCALKQETPVCRGDDVDGLVRDKPPRPPTRKKILIETPKDYVIPVFQAVNIKGAPRMYYKPWGGDKLPVAERTLVKHSPAFY